MDPDTFWDKAMKLPNRARYWYEVSTRWMQSQGAKDPEQLRRVMDMVAATSPQLQPYPNLARALGVLAEHSQRTADSDRLDAARLRPHGIVARGLGRAQNRKLLG